MTAAAELPEGESGAELHALPSVGPHRNLNADTDPHGTDVHQVANHVDSMRWLLTQLGAGGLSGMLRRGEQVVYTAMIDEDGYVPPAGENDENGPATVRPVVPETIVARLAMNYLVWKWGGTKADRQRVETFFPVNAVRHALELVDEAPNLHTLRGVTHTPMVRRDGSILAEPGFDRATGFLFLPTVDVPPVPEHPTREQTAAATTFLRGLFAEFTWAGEHDEANYLGLLLTPLLRELTPPPYKLAAIMARQPGSGKSLLARVLREVHGGVFRSEMPHDDAELEKALSSILSCTTAPVVTWDNVTGILRSSRLAGLLTSGTFSGRILGSTNNVDMVNDRLWTITGNNVTLGGDLVRRTLWVTIDPGVPNPEARTGFRIANLAGYVAEHRGDVLHALLVLVRSWVVAGWPAHERSSDDYARWSAVVRGILTVAGVPGEFDHAESAQQTAAVGDDDWEEFLTAVHDVFGERRWTVRELLSKVHDGRDTAPVAGVTFNGAAAYDAEHPIPLDVLPADLAEKFARNGAGRVTKSLGMWLRFREGRWAGAVTCRRASERGRDGVPWVVETFRGGHGE